MIHGPARRMCFVFLVFAGLLAVAAGFSMGQDSPPLPAWASGARYAHFPATGTTDDSYRVDLVGRWASGPCLDVAVQGNTAYIVAGGKMEVVDCSQVWSPVVVGDLVLSNFSVNIAVDGDYAYVTDVEGDLHVIDVSDPADPAWIGVCHDAGGPGDIAVSGGYAYVADYGDGLRVIDVSDPADPTEVGLCLTGSAVTAVSVLGNHACVVDSRDGGLHVIDVSDPADPTEVGFCVTYFEAFGMVVAPTTEGVRAFVAGGFSGLFVFSLSDPTSPIEIGFCPTGEPGFAYDVTVSGDYAYVANAFDLAVISVSDPANPAKIGGCPAQGYAMSVAVSGSYAYTANFSAGLRAISIYDPTHPIESGSYVTGELHDVAVSGGHAYVANAHDGLRVLDVSNPANPTAIGSCDTPGLAQGVAVSGAYAYVADGYEGLRVIDVSNPADPIAVGFYVAPGPFHEVAVSGDYAYAPDNDEGLHVIDVSDPANPAPVGYCWTIHTIEEVAVSEDFAYVVGDGAFEVIDVSDPTDPTVVGGYGPYYGDYVFSSVAVSGDYAYVAAYDTFGSGHPDSLLVIDVSDPASPIGVGSCDTPDGVEAVAVSGNHVFVTAGGGLRVVDVTNPTNPVESGFYEIAGWGSEAVAVSGNQAYVANYFGLYILDCTGAVPVFLQRLAATVDGNGIRVDWEVAEETGIREYRLYRSLSEGNPGVPALLATIPSRGARQYSFFDADVSRGRDYRYTLLAVEDAGREWELGSCAVNVEAPSAISLRQNVPNPFNPGTRITVELPEPADVDLSIYDVKGRLVARLFSGRETAGIKHYTWDGTDATGRRASSGVYFYRLAAGNRTLEKKMVLMR